MTGSLAFIIGTVAVLAAPLARPAAERELADGALAVVPASQPDAADLPPLVIMLHGAGQDARTVIGILAAHPRCTGHALLAPKSVGVTWDAVNIARRKSAAGMSLEADTLLYSGSADGRRIAASVRSLADIISYDRENIVVAGFSDGATMALAFGTGQSLRLRKVVAIAPGVPARARQVARGRNVVVLHGLADRVVPADMSRKSIVPMLRRVGAKVSFRTFEGGHTITEAAVLEICGVRGAASTADAVQVSNHAGPG